MKRVGNLYDKIFTYDNIYKAILKASLGKRNRKKVKYCLEHIDETIKAIIDNPHIKGDYTKRKVIDKASGKEREILEPSFFPDQIIHHSVMQVLEPILLKGKYQWCCASIKHRGIDYASKKVRKILRTDKRVKYFVKLDVRKYYPSINQKILKSKFRKYIKDEKVLNLLDSIVDSVEIGIPIGNYTSQIFANLYLQDFDHYVKEVLKIPYYIRYMDDMLLIGYNRRKLMKSVEIIKYKLETDYLLITHNNEEVHLISNNQNSNGRCIDFVGFKHYKEVTTIRRRTFRRIRRLILRMNNLITLKRARAFFSYWGYLIHSDSFQFIHNNIKFKINILKKLIGGKLNAGIIQC